MSDHQDRRQASMSTEPDLLREWEERERLLATLVDYFSDGEAEIYAAGCLFATRRCIEDLRVGGAWVQGYMAGLRKGRSERIEAARSTDAADPQAEGRDSRLRTE